MKGVSPPSRGAGGAGFVDEAILRVSAGRGGNGCRSFYKDLWTRYPICDGGSGGRGGAVRVRANPQLTTLLDFQKRRHFKAGPGGHGSSKNQQGARGADCLIEVPLGTVLYDAQTGELIRELLQADEEVIVARGGTGGIGNGSQSKARAGARSRCRKGFRLKQPPRFDPALLPGAAGETRTLRLELKSLADVGLVGMPNAGKSTLIRKISQARPRVAAYPFTTRHPVLGVVSSGPGRAFTAVDVPGLIEGAHEGKGLGIQFLRHIERTRLLLHLVDMAGADGRDPVEDYRVLLEEIKAYRPDLAWKPRMVVANKMDLEQAQEQLKQFKQRVKDRPIVEISAQTGVGVRELLKKVSTQLERLKKNG